MSNSKKKKFKYKILFFEQIKKKSYLDKTHCQRVTSLDRVNLSLICLLLYFCTDGKFEKKKLSVRQHKCRINVLLKVGEKIKYSLAF